MQQITRADRTVGAYEASREIVDTHGVVLRNYDGEDAHELSVEFRDGAGTVVFDRTFPLDPLDTVAVRPHIKADIYRVTVDCDGGRTASEECLIGSQVGEAALIEVGNGVVSLTDGLF
jgi:hypothetical protein